MLAPCGCVVDRLILTATESVWQVHENGARRVDDDDRKALEAEREVTMALITYKSPLAAVTFPRYVNASTGMQAAAPAVEVSRLLRMLGVGSEVLRGVGAVLLLTAALSVFIALWNAVRERRADLAMLRMLGATPAKVAALLLCEALWLAVLASVLGLAAGHGLTALVGYLLEAQRSLPITGRHLGAGRGVDSGGGRRRGDAGGADPGGQRLPGRRGPVAQFEVRIMKKMLLLAACAAAAGAGRPKARKTSRRTRSATAPWPPPTRRPPNAWNRARSPTQCQKELQAACKGLAIGKYCGMKHEH